MPILPILPILQVLPVTSQLVARGAGGRGEALGFAAPPEGEQGVQEFIQKPDSAESAPREGPQMSPTPAAGPSQK